MSITTSANQIALRREAVRVADTATVTALNADCVARNRAHVLSDELVQRLDPDGYHLLWAAFPHSQQEIIRRVPETTGVALPDRIAFRNGSPQWPSSPHVRTCWLLSVRDGSPKEGIIHLDHEAVIALPEYDRPADSGFPPADGVASSTRPDTLHAADTPTLLELNSSSIAKNHNQVLPADLAGRIDPDGIHLLWGTFPHNLEITVTAAAESTGQLPRGITLRNGSPGSPEIPHLRTMWLVSVVDGDPVEAHLHFDFAEVRSLPEYERTEPDA
jgi:hypothetical protein